MFYKDKFSEILKQIKETYNSQEEFSKYSGVGRTYISQYMNGNLDTPPKPKILEKIANSSKGITTYDELMQICGYTNYMIDFFFDGAVHQSNDKIPIVYDIRYDAEKNIFVVDTDSRYISANFFMDDKKEYFAYKVKDDSMLPLLDVGDLAIIEKTDKYSNGQTCLVSLENKTILIRKIVDFKDYIELHTAFSYSQPLKLTKEEMIEKHFTVLGKVIKAEINFK
jgi:SOS-response transcriptional repressor LexA